MNAQWGQTPHPNPKKSWHIARETFDFALCGRRLDPDTIRDERPGNMRTCETCLRIVAPK